MKISLRREDDEQTALALHMLTFPSDEWVSKPNAHWIARDERGSPVGFCSARKLKREGAVFLSRAGVLPAARGIGLQRRMIDVRVRWARTFDDCQHVITYTTYENHPSITNLIKSGFRFYTPHYRYAGAVHYFQKVL